MGRVAGFDTGSWLMADAGLLEGHAATIHASLADSFAERFPEVTTRRERWVDDGGAAECRRAPRRRSSWRSTSSARSTAPR